MAKVKVTLNLNVLDAKKAFGRRFHAELGKEVVNEMKKLIGSGLSPVKGVGRFVAYATQRKGDPKAYPLSVKKKFPAKQVRPVNLKLNGTFLDTLSYKANEDRVEIGHIEFSSHTRDLFEAHNEGLNKNVPKRKYLPNKRGEDFVATIMTLIKSIYAKQFKK